MWYLVQEAHIYNLLEYLVTFNTANKTVYIRSWYGRNAKPASDTLLMLQNSPKGKDQLHSTSPSNQPVIQWSILL